MTIKSILSVCCIFFLLPVYSQEIDSLKKLLQGKIGIERAEVLNKLAWAYVDIDNNLASEYSLEAYSMAKELCDSLRMVKDGKVLASALRRSGQTDSAIFIFARVLRISREKNYENETISILNGLAIAYMIKARYDKALEYHFQSLELRERSRDTASISIALSNIGAIYYKLKDFDKGLVYFKRCLELKRKIKDNYDLDRLLINIGLSYASKNNFYDAKKYVEEGLTTCGDNCSDNIITEANFSLGVIFFGLEKLTEAEVFFKKSYLLAKRINERRFHLDNLDYLSRIYILRNQPGQAIIYLTEAEQLINTGSGFTLEFMKIYARFFEVYYKTKDFEKVAHYQQKYIELKDSVHNEEHTINLMRIESEFLERENNVRIAAQNQILLLKEEAMRQQKILIITVSLVALCVVIIAIMLFKSSRQRKTINELLEIKIKERTNELELNRNELLKAYEEQDLLMKKTAQHIRSSLATIKGICNGGLKDITDPNARQYIQEVEHTSEGLSRTLLVLQPAKEKEHNNSHLP